MEWILLGLGLLWLLESQPGGFSFSPPVATPGTQVNVPGTGFGVIIPSAGTTYHTQSGHTVTVLPGAMTSPYGFVMGSLEDNSIVWFNPATGAIQNI